MIEEIRRGKKIPIDVDIMDIFDEDATTSLSQLYPQSTIKEEPSNTKIGTNHVGAFEEPTKGFQRLEVGTKGEGVETRVKKLIYGTMPPQIEHPTVVERASIRPYTENDMLHMMLEMEYIMPIIPTFRMYYLMH